MLRYKQIATSLSQGDVMDEQTQAELVRAVMSNREIEGERTIPRRYVKEAVRRIAAGEEDCEEYPAGWPSLTGITDIAVKLEKQAKEN